MYLLKLRERDSWISLMSTPDSNPPDLSVKCQHKMAKTKLFLSKYAYLHVVRISTGILVNTRWPKPNLSFVKVFHSAFTLIHIPDLITVWQSIELFNIVIVVPIPFFWPNTKRKKKKIVLSSLYSKRNEEVHLRAILNLKKCCKFVCLKFYLPHYLFILFL